MLGEFIIAALCLRKLFIDILAGDPAAATSSISSTTSNLLFDERVLVVVLSVDRVEGVVEARVVLLESSAYFVLDEFLDRSFRASMVFGLD